MNKKLLRYFGMLLLAMVCLGATAQTSTFKYTATEKLERFEEFQYFIGATGVKSHDWDAATGEGTVVYEGTVTELGSYALQFQRTMTALVIPEGVTTLGFQSMQACYNLSSVSLPKSLKHVMGQAFYATGFAAGKFIIDDLAWWCSIQFDGIDSNPLCDAKHVYSDEDTEITDLVIPEGVSSIGSYSFVKCEGIKSVTFPSTLTAIGSHAFYQSGLESVDIPKGITTIEESTFYGCANLKRVTIPEGVTSIGYTAFVKCGIESLTLPSTIREMSQSFYHCEQLASLTISEGVTNLNGSFYYCHALKEVHIPSTVRLTYQDFTSCDNLETVTFAEGVEVVEGFGSCPKLSSVTIPSTVARIEGLAFRNCNNLTSVTCMAMEPPYTASTIPFGNGISMEGRTLYVPSFTLNTYKEAKNWKEFPDIQPLHQLPANIVVRDEMHLTLTADIPEGKPSVSLRHESDPQYGILTIGGEGSLMMSSFNIRWEPFYQYWKYDRALNYCSLQNNATMEADNVSVDMNVSTKVWTFASLPFDWKVGDIEPVDEGVTEWAVRTYDSRKRADGEMTETWVKMAGDDIIEAGQGFIVMGQYKDASGRTKDNCTLHFRALDNASKNNMFRTMDISVPLTVYDSEFKHNCNWNFIGNPYPSYFDVAYMDFRAPVTVWNMNNNNYVALRPGDDDYVLCPGEGFFVQCPDDKQEIVFSKDGRRTTRSNEGAGTRGDEDTPAADISRAIFNIIMTSGDNVDRTRIVINEAASAQYELDKDASKFFTDDADMPQLYTEGYGVNYAINERPLGDGIVTLCTTAGNGGLCTISLAKDVEGYEVTLEDPATGTTVALNDSQPHSFYGNGQTFLLHFSNNATGICTIGAVPIVRNGIRYNLSGQRVTDTYKGLVITNGKKIIKN